MTRRTTSEPPLISRCAKCGEVERIEFGMSPREVKVKLLAFEHIHEWLHTKEREGTIRWIDRPAGTFVFVDREQHVSELAQ